VEKARVLIVDDEDANVEILARYLESRGHAVCGAADAEEAVAAVRRDRFDLVLVDIVLPGRTGLQALPDLRALTRAPLVVMSGQSDPDTRLDALALGAADFLPKPLDLPRILALIAELPGPS